MARRREIDAARSQAIEDGKLEGQRIASTVRALPLAQIAKMLGGRADPGNRLRWALPSLGWISINSDKPHRFKIESTAKSGGGAIDLVMAETGRDFEGAVRFLRTEVLPEDIVADAAHAAARKMGVTVHEMIKQLPAPSLEDLAPSEPSERDAVRGYLRKSGVAEHFIDAAFDANALEATKQGSRVMCRWSLCDRDDEPVGFGLEAIDASFVGLRGGEGLCSFDLETGSRFVHPEIGATVLGRA